MTIPIRLIVDGSLRPMRDQRLSVDQLGRSPATLPNEAPFSADDLMANRRGREA